MGNDSGNSTVLGTEITYSNFCAYWDEIQPEEVAGRETLINNQPSWLSRRGKASPGLTWPISGAEVDGDERTLKKPVGVEEMRT